MKDPAFLFYSKDWLEGTAELMPEEKGIYIDLLAHQHQKGSLPTDTKRLSRIVGLTEENFLPIWKEIEPKFERQGDRTVNRKLEQVVTERLNKGRKNKLIGTFAHVLKKMDLSKTEEKELKKRFNVDELLENNTEWNTERLTEWCLNGVPFIEDEDGDGSKDEYNKTWKNDFNTYLKECKQAYKNFVEDEEKIKTQERLNPRVDVKLSIEKGFTNYWGIEKGWKNKKAKKIKNIDWEATIKNSITNNANKVYLPKK